MPPQQLLLSWKDHNGALVSIFENLLKRNTLVDCTLAAEGQYLKAHKMVLSACSSYFELLFSQESEKNPIVILKDVKFQELKAAVNFMYRGEVEVCEDRLAAFLEVADSLQIKGLGCDGKTRDSKTAVPPKAHCRKEVNFTQNENTQESSIIIDSDKNSNERSSHHHVPYRETSGSSPIPSTLGVASSFSIASASTSCPVRAETNRDRDKAENNQCSSPSVSTFPPGDTVPSDVNTVIKTEPVCDTYVEEKSDEVDRDYDDVTMMEDQEDWDDSNVEYMGDDHASNQHDPGFAITNVKTIESTIVHNAGMTPQEHISSEDFSVTHVKTEAPTTEHNAGTSLIEHVSSEDNVWTQDRGGGSSSTSAPHFAVFFKDHHETTPEPVPGAGPVPGSASGVAPPRQGGVPEDSGQRWKASLTLLRGVFQCSHCGYAAPNSHVLARHLRVHTGEKPYKCTLCSYATSQSGNLTVHMRQHSQEKPYQCTVCGYATRHQGNLNQHVRTHTGEKPYVCSMCNVRYTQSKSLKKHNLLFHNETCR